MNSEMSENMPPQENQDVPGNGQKPMSPEQLLGLSEQIQSDINSSAQKVSSGVDESNSQKQQQNETRRPVKIGERLLEAELISKDQLSIALQEQKSSDKKRQLGTILVEMGFITESALGEVLAESTGTARFDPKTTMLDVSLVKVLPKDLALRHKVIPIAFNEGVLDLAMSDVYNVLAIDQVRRHFPEAQSINPLYCIESEIIELIENYFAYEVSIGGILREIETGIKDNSTQLDGSQEGYTNPTVRLVDALLVDAIKSGASDIHFEPEGAFLRLRYRIDGQMRQIRSFHKDYWSAMLVRMKIMSGMNIAETRMPQDGRISMNAFGREVDFRVATHPTVHGENVVLRLLDKKKALLPIGKLGFSSHNRDLLKKLLKRPEGIIVVTGPTGSGKTTTLYSILSYINSMDVNIMTLEDPVEYQLPLIRQTNVKEGSVDFENGISSLMRQDPDIVFVGEMRNKETAIMAVRAALTGHQVYSTLHTNDSVGAIPRLNDIGVPSHLLAGSLICVIAQRLARRLCGECKEPYFPDVEECKIMGLDALNPPQLYKARGCPECNETGYKGRVACVEILAIDSKMDELIATQATRNTILEYATESGFKTMADDGIDKILNGLTSLDELISRIDMTDRM